MEGFFPHGPIEASLDGIGQGTYALVPGARIPPAYLQAFIDDEARLRRLDSCAFRDPLPSVRKRRPIQSGEFGDNSVATRRQQTDLHGQDSTGWQIAPTPLLEHHRESPAGHDHPRFCRHMGEWEQNGVDHANLSSETQRGGCEPPSSFGESHRPRASRQRFKWSDEQGGLSGEFGGRSGANSPPTNGALMSARRMQRRAALLGGSPITGRLSH